MAFALLVAVSGVAWAVFIKLGHDNENPNSSDDPSISPSLAKTSRKQPIRNPGIKLQDGRDLSLREIPVDLEFSPDAKPIRTVFFDTPDLENSSKFGPLTGLLCRELYRQAMSIAARDELGLLVRDATLHESAPPDLPLANHFLINVCFAPVKYDEIKIEVGPKAGSRVIWHARADQQSSQFELPAYSLSVAEPLSRDVYIKALKKAGHRGQANRVSDKAEVPPEVDKLLIDMRFTSQFAACRLIHDVIRDQGESAATLGALARVYANLGMLTENQWDSMTWVFKARSLLYAERLRQRDSKSPWSYWNRGYAFAVTGLHKNALSDFKSAEDLRGGVNKPKWAQLAEWLCTFQTKSLADASAMGPYADTAKVFRFLTIESYAGLDRARTVGAEVLEALPECYRVHNSLADLGGVGKHNATNREAFKVQSETFSKRVGEIPNIPQSVRDLCRDDVPEVEFIKGLRAAGHTASEQGTPSLETLAAFSRENRLLQVNASLWYLRRSLVVSADEYFKEVKPLLADHPLFPFLETYLLHPERDRVEYESKLRALKLPELTRRHTRLLLALQLLGNKERVLYGGIAEDHGNHLYYDDYCALRNVAPNVDASPYAQLVLKNSPYAPIARSTLILHNWKSVKDQAADWENQAQHPEIFIALGRQAMKENRWDDAERVFRKSIALSRDRESYQFLAEMFKAKGDDNQWLTVLESYLKETEPDLTHGQVRVSIAEHFMAKQEFDKAKPYAESAGATGSEWGMRCAAQCAEGLGDWQSAEEYIKSVTERYEAAYSAWYFWCIRTGRGDRAAAQKIVEEQLAKSANSLSRNDMISKAVYLAATGTPKQVPQFLIAYQEKYRHDGILMMALAEFEANGNPEMRDRIFEIWPKKSDIQTVVELLRGMKGKDAKDLPTQDSIDAVLKPLPLNDQAYCSYGIGRFLQQRGQKNLAAHYFRKCNSVTGNRDTVLLAMAALAIREIERK